MTKAFRHLIVILILICYSSSQRITTRISPPPPLKLARVSNLRDHIQNILQMSDGSLLSSMFSIKTSNPTYIFQLPTKYHDSQSIVLRRSDFAAAVYPNVTQLRDYNNKFGQFQSASAKLDSNDRHGLSAQLANFKSSDINLEDAATQKVIEDNVGSEREFADYVTEFNRNHPTLGLRTNFGNGNKPLVNPTNAFNRRSTWKSRIKKKQLHQHRTTGGINWDSLGLPGWAGGLTDVDYFGDDDESSELFKDNAPKATTRGVSSFQSYGITTPFEGQKTASVQFSKNTFSTTKKAKDLWDLEAKIPDELMNLLKTEDVRLYNMTRALKQKRLPHFPITTSRSRHRDDDVFIARANNPFGHSTKWEKSNATQSVEGRSKRGALELYSMIKCSTGCDPLIFKGYGCYCGFLGSGRTLDPIDRCCKMHDYCYEVSNCVPFLEYFVPYLWKCYHGKPLCAIDHGEWGGPGSCASRLCECDQALSKCLRRFHCPRKRPVCTTSPWRLLQNVIMDV